MPRDLSTPMFSALEGNKIAPCFLVEIAFKSQTVYCWTGVGSLTYGGNTYLGVGALGEVQRVVEDTELQAAGTSISLSGIDSTLLSECMTDIQLGAPVTIYLALLDVNGNIIGAPYPLFGGIVDQPQVRPGVDSITISLALESLLSNHGRPSNRRYTAADQNIYYPGDTAFNWVESLNDQALRWSA